MKFQHLLLILLVAALITPAALSQIPERIWSITTGGPGWDYFNDVTVMLDGTIVGAGGYENGGEYNYDFYLVKISAVGEQIWSQLYGTNHNMEQVQDVCFCDGGGILLTGLTIDTQDMYVIRTDRYGNALWQYQHPVSFDYVTAVPSDDGCWYLAGTNDLVVNDDFELIKIDDQGNIIFFQLYDSGYNNDRTTTMIRANDGNLIIAGHAVTGSYRYPRVIKVSPEGDLIWDCVYTTISYGRIYGGTRISDGYAFAGHYGSSQADFDMLLLVVDENGNLQFSNTYGGQGSQRAWDVCQDTDGGFVLAGHDGILNDPAMNNLLVKASASGDHIWTMNSGAAGMDGWFSIQSIDTGFLVSGSFTPQGEIYTQAIVDRYGDPDLANIDIDPATYPFTIPAIGGEFTFSARIYNTLLNPQTGHAWIDVTTPGGTIFNAGIFPVNLQPGSDINVASFLQTVPGFAPPGMYTYQAKLGLYPVFCYTLDEIVFEKLAVSAADFAAVSPVDWSLSGSFVSTNRPQVSDQPIVFALSDGYPNPFNASINIEIALPEPADLTVQVVDVTGRIVTELADGHLSAGVHRLTLSAENYASGIYFVRAIVPDRFEQTRKVVLVR